MNKKITIFIFAALLQVILAGCTNQSSEIGQKQDDSMNNEKREEIVLAFDSEPETGFDPVVGWGRYGSPLFQSTLFKRNDELEIVNDLAEKYEVNNHIWTVYLRDDVQFSDGEKLTANDVVFTFNKILESGSVVDLNLISEVKALDKTTVQFELKEPQSTFINALVGTGIVPEHAYSDDYAENPIGSGPFKLVEWRKGEQLIIEANEYYYDERPHFKKITFLFLAEDASLAAAKTGQVDFAYIPASFSNQQVEGMRLESIETVDNRGIAFPMVEAGEVTKEGIVIGNDVTADVAIRQAVNIAIDRQVLVEGVLEGHGTPAHTSVDKLPWWNPETVIDDGDRLAAEKILTDAGWEKNKEAIFEKLGLKAEFTLYYPANDTIRQSLAISVADMLKPLGISVQVEGASWEIIGEKMHSNPILMGWGSHDPYEMFNIYGSENAGIEYYNTGYYKNEVVDHYFEQAIAATSEDEAIEYWKKAQWDGKTGFSAKGDAAWAWLVNINHLYLVNDKLDIGKQRIHVHGHGWPVTDNIVDWKWKDES